MSETDDQEDDAAPEAYVLFAETGHFRITGLDGVSDCKKIPGPGALHLGSGGRIAMTKDGSDGTETNDFYGSSASKVVDGYLHIEVQGAPPVGKRNEPYIRAILSGLVKHEKQSDPRVEVGIDANGEDGIFVFPDGDRLTVQMVTVPVDTDYWNEISKGDKVSVRVPVEEAAAWIHVAAEKKQRAIGPSERARIVLALDSRHGAQLAHEEIAESFHRQFGDGSQYGFHQIWLVGPVSGRSRQLFPPPVVKR